MPDLAEGEPSGATVPGAEAAEIFAQLEGTWALRREIPGIGTMDGAAFFDPLLPGTLLYREEGRLSLQSGYSGPATREYYYLLEKDHIRVTFADAPPGERTFVTLRPERGSGDTFRAADVHYCTPDLYSATYHFSNERLTISTGVRGPKKDYTILTTLTRDPETRRATAMLDGSRG
ncbi:DUF6314 family protein [Parafrankia sp. Ea1.12]|uniref:DUF6314 family protein n=1 Tax=Parafrankia sp. Ea1.12 TaxID=573499 RepID=UPI000DD35FEE|nr:DUF6314 family protein [Parafrankia sp. Ea1.12]